MDPTIRIQSRLGKRPQRKRADAGNGCVRDADATPAPPFADTLARRLALAHHIERLIDDGKLRNYAHAAAVLGITRARMSQLMDLALLSPRVQERLLLGTSRYCERDVWECLDDHNGAHDECLPPATDVLVGERCRTGTADRSRR